MDPVDFFADYVDTGGHSTSAIEVRHKMKSKQSCWEQVGAGKVEEDFEICSKINQGIIDWAMNKLRCKLVKYICVLMSPPMIFVL